MTTADDHLLYKRARELLSNQPRWPSSNRARSRSGLRDARREFESAFCPGGIVVAERREGRSWRTPNAPNTRASR